MTKKDYTADSIQVLDGLEGVRKRPSMYIGDTTSNSGINQCIKEILDNAYDECSNGYSKTMGFIVQENKTYVIYDEGRGIPVEIHPKFKKEKKSTLEVVMTMLHAGGKMNTDSYKNSVGRNGVGVSVCTALSESMIVTTYRNKKWYKQEFKQGKVVSQVIETENPCARLNIKIKQGTIIEWRPDYTIFAKDTKCVANDILQWMKFSRYLLPNITFIYDNRKTGKYKELKSSKGISGYLDKICEEYNAEELSKPLLIQLPNIDLSMKWIKTDGNKIQSYVNGSPTDKGGTHIKGLTKVINEVISSYAKKSDKYKADDLLEGLICILNYKIDEPLFDSQTKNCLVNNGAIEDVYNLIKPDLTKWAKENKNSCIEIIKRADDIRGAKLQFEQAKKAIASVKGKRGKSSLPPSNKFSGSTTKNDADRELYLVEGDSASGTAKSAKNHIFQEVLGLRGKFLNAEKTTLAKLVESDEVINILKAIGYNFEDKTLSYRVGKVIMLTDADSDGCLDGNTRILTLDGKNPTIKELTEQYEQDGKSIQVYSVDKDGNLVIGEAIKPRITRKVDEMIELTFDNGSVIKCTLDHKWLVNNPDITNSRLIEKYGLYYILAKDLKETDSIRSVCDKELYDNRVINKNIISSKQEVYCMTVPNYGNFMVADKFGNGICSSNSHIDCLICVLLQKLCPDLIEKGMLYKVDAPLFVGRTETTEYYGENMADLKRQYKGKFKSITRIKGWGEASTELLKKVAFDIKTRKLLKVKAVKGDELRKALKLMSDDSESRKELLSERVK